MDVTPLADLKRRRLVVYENLKDLEFEYQAGKIAAQDYQNLKQNYLGEAATPMAASQEAEHLKESDALLEREIAARRALRKNFASPGVCPRCGFENPVLLDTAREALVETSLDISEAIDPRYGDFEV